MRAIIVPPGQGHRVGNVEFLARSADTPRFNLGLITLQPHREGPELHTHADEDDSFYVLEGELTFIHDDDEVVARPGTFVLVPPGIPHTFAFTGDDEVRFLDLHTPSCGYGAFLRGLHEARIDEDLDAVRAAFDQEPA